jgi:hypothetical protein
MALIFGPDTYTVAADTRIDEYPSVGDPDYNYLFGSGTNLRAIAASDRLEVELTPPTDVSARVIDATVPAAMADQEARCRGSCGSGGGIDNEYGTLVRANTASPDNTCYFALVINRTNELEIDRKDSDGTTPTLASADRGLISDREYTFAFRAVGSALRLVVGGWTELTVTDATYATGRPGVWVYNNGGIDYADDFEVDNLGTGTLPWEVGQGAQAVSITDGGSVTAAFPAGYSAVTDDFAIVLLAGRPTGTVEPGTPAGWTKDSTRLREVGANDLRISLYYRKLVAGDAAPAFTVPTSWSGAAAGMSVSMVVYRGVNTTTPFDATTVGSDAAAAATFTPTGITTVTANAHVVSLVASSDANSLRASTPQFFTQWMGGASYDTVTGGAHAIGLASRQVPSAGTVTMPTWTQDAVGTDPWAGLSAALRPEGGGAPGVAPGEDGYFVPIPIMRW